MKHKQTRGRASKIQLLPQALQDELNALLRSKKHTQEEIREAINERIDEVGLDEDSKISRSGLNRYATRMETIGKRIRESREMARIWTEKLGQEPEGDIGKLLMEFVKQLAFDTTMSLNETGEPIPAKALSELALVAQRIEQAQMANIKREQEIRRLAIEEAAEVAEQVASKGGLSAESVEMLRREILGITQ